MTGATVIYGVLHENRQIAELRDMTARLVPTNEGFHPFVPTKPVIAYSQTVLTNSRGPVLRGSPPGYGTQFRHRPIGARNRGELHAPEFPIANDDYRGQSRVLMRADRAYSEDTRIPGGCPSCRRSNTYLVTLCDPAEHSLNICYPA